jgi:hypothetical protein
MSEVQAFEEALKVDGQSHARRSVEIALAQRRWALARYPRLAEPGSPSPLP